jgi:hypothetical protein
MFVGFVLGKVYKANCDVFRAELTSGNRSNRATWMPLLKLERWKQFSHASLELLY